MVHAADRGVTQNLDAADVGNSRWTKNVIDAPVVDRRVARAAPEIAKVAQYVAVRFAIVLQIVSIKICLVRGFEFEVEITGEENGRRLRSRLRPIDQCFGVGPAARGVERVSVRAQKQYRLRAIACLE